MKLRVLFAGFLALYVVGCDSPPNTTPQPMTPENIAKQKADDAAVIDGEREHQKTQAAESKKK